MPCPKTVPRTDWTECVTNTTTARQRELTGWMPTAGLTEMSFVLWTANVVNEATAKPAYQLATFSPEKPDAWTVISDGSYATAASTNYREAVTEPAALWIRYGVSWANSSGTNLGGLQAMLDVNEKKCGKVIGRRTIDIRKGAFGTEVEPQYYELGGWQPAVGLSKLKWATAVVDNATADLQVKLVIRGAVDREAPATSWIEVESFITPAAGSSSRCSAATDDPTSGFTVASYAWFQLGVACQRKTSSSAAPQAIVHAIGTATWA